MKVSRDYTISSVKKALDILNLFDDQRVSLSLSEISVLSGIGKSSIFRILYTLCNEEFLSYDEDKKKYSLGIAIYRLGISKFHSLDLRKVARRYLQNLSNETEMICYVSIRDGDQLIMLDQFLPSRIPTWTQLVVQAGGTSALYSTGNGRLFLSQESDEEIADYLERVELKKFTEETITDKSILMELIRQAKKDGFSGNLGENERHVCSLCAPIYDRDKKMIAACSICGMKDEIYSPKYNYYLSKICDVAKLISHDMGYLE